MTNHANGQLGNLNPLTLSGWHRSMKKRHWVIVLVWLVMFVTGVTWFVP